MPPLLRLPRGLPTCRRSGQCPQRHSLLLGLFALTIFWSGLQPDLARAASAAVRGSLIIAGNGPEHSMVEALARAFEKAQPSAYVDLLWDKTANPVELVRAGEAQVAVTAAPDADLRATQIAWDGIGIVVHLSNNAKDLTSRQIADIFSGKHAYWSEVGGPDTKILVIDRPRYENVREAFETHLGISGKIPSSAPVLAKDEKVVKTVVGTLPPNSAVAYLSLAHALAAVRSGVAIRLLTVDKVEPEEPTVKDGRYKLRRPVLLLSGKENSPVVAAFEDFCYSPTGQQIIDEFYTPFSRSSQP